MPSGPRAPTPFHRIAVLFATGLAAAGMSQAQTTGTLEGTVRDLAGAPLPGAAIVARSPRLQGIRTAVTARNGQYRFPAVPPGEYRVDAALDGFRAAQSTGIVALDATATVDFALEPSIEERIAVTGEAPLVDTTATTTGTNYTSRITSRLPVGRNYADIVRSNPGVDTDRGETQGRSLALTVYGATSAENLWLIDGINTTNVIKGGQGKAINNEFVEEVEVKTGAYQAEYGRAIGGVVNVITKSGGNAFHGGGFFYYDSDATRARQKVTADDLTLADMRVAGYDREDFGVDLGGFLLKDRLWFFTAYDRIDMHSKVSRYVSTPFVSSSDEFPIRGANNLYSGKLTWKLAAASTFVATVFADPTTNGGAAGSDPSQGFGGIGVPPITNRSPSTWSSQRRIGGRDYALRLNQVFGSVALMTLQGSHHEDRYDLTAAEIVSTIDERCTGGRPDQPCSFPFVPNNQTGGFGSISGPRNRNDSRRDQARAEAALFLGSHEVKGGGDYEDAKTTAVSSYTGGQLVRLRNEQGVDYYRHLFYAVSPSDLTPIASSTVAPRTLDTGIFLQDAWRPAAGWTINAGLRWDDERVENYSGQTVIHTSEWQPRLGVVWDPGKDGRTKIFAFAGRFSYALPTDLAVRSYGDVTQVFTYNFDPLSLGQAANVPGHPRALFQTAGPFTTPVDTGLRGISQDELTLGVERLLDAETMIGIKGTYRRLNDAIEDRCDLDYTRPETSFSSCGIMNPGSRGAIARGNVPGCNGFATGDGSAYQCTDTIPSTPAARRVYRGIEVFGRKRWEDKLWIQVSYVYSSLRGNYDGEVSNGFFGQTDPGINADFDYAAANHNSYGRLFLDRPHRFRLDGFYTTPVGLSIGLQVFASTGAPRNRLGFFNDFYGSLIQLVPKGTAGRLPAEADANLVLQYPIRVGPATVTLQAYVFRIFNRQTPTAVDPEWTISAPAGYPETIYDPMQPSDNPNYGKITAREEPRYFRAAIRVSF